MNEFSQIQTHSLLSVLGFPLPESVTNSCGCHMCFIAITSENCLDNCTAVGIADTELWSHFSDFMVLLHKMNAKCRLLPFLSMD